MEAGNHCTIDDLARELGVSKTTISRAISGKGRISEETRRRVFDLMRERGYRPSAAAKSLAERRTCNLALVLPEDCGEEEMTRCQHILTGACALASRQDYDILIVSVSPGNPRQLQRVLANRKTDGAILAAVSAEAVALLRRNHLPFVCIGRTGEPGALFVDHDHRGACGELTGLLLRMGLVNPVLLTGDDADPANRARAEGFLDACARFGVPSGTGRVCENAEQGFFLDSAIEDALGRGADLLLCADERICQRTMLRLGELGVDVPGRVCVASCYDSAALQNGAVPVTSLRFAPKLLGMEACRLLLRRLEGQEAESRLLPEHDIALRASTKRY